MVKLKILLLLSGDVETNPGPAREKKPDPKKIMEDKVNSHDEKIAALEQLVKEQKKMLEAMTEKQVELQTALEDSKVELTKSLEDKKVLDASVRDIKMALGEGFEKQVDLNWTPSFRACLSNISIKNIGMSILVQGRRIKIWGKIPN